MRLRQTLGLSVALILMSGAALAATSPATSAQPPKAKLAKPTAAKTKPDGKPAPAKKTVALHQAPRLPSRRNTLKSNTARANTARASTARASTVRVIAVRPNAVRPNTDRSNPVRLTAAHPMAAVARPIQAAYRVAVPADVGPVRTPPGDRIVGATRPIGRREIGSAAWYGGSLVGMRTASGSRLDAIHPTAAHRSLPLNSLARVTNLKNGRSVVVTVNDRGPVSPSLAIDLSPSAADELDMKRDGIVPVSIEQVTAEPALH